MIKNQGELPSLTSSANNDQATKSKTKNVHETITPEFLIRCLQSTQEHLERYCHENKKLRARLSEIENSTIKPLSTETKPTTTPLTKREQTKSDKRLAKLRNHFRNLISQEKTHNTLNTEICEDIKKINESGLFNSCLLYRSLVV